ncbi:MAG: DUF4382 domain-containing protein [Sphingobacteriia bacterium]|nr:DUF4382 domain-containing protein [Sphingobacteriia bacterium]
MKKQQLKRSIVVSSFFVCLAIIACNKSGSLETATTGTQNVSLSLTDGPGLYDSVFIEIKDVKVLLDTSSNTRKNDNCDYDRMGDFAHHKPDSSFIWQDLNVAAGVYNLLSLRNGVDTVLASGTIKAGSIRLIRIDLGANNYFVKDSVKYPLNIPPNAPSYILVKLMGNEFGRFGSTSRLWLDFDIQRSIVQLRDYKFYLTPYIRAFLVTQTGTVTGTITPKDALPAIISVYSNTDTLYAITNRDGFFKIRGLKDGNYTIFVNPSNGYKTATLSNQAIINASTDNVGTITLKK